MKILYDITNQTVITWWNDEIGTGVKEDPSDYDNTDSKIYDIPSLTSPDALDFPLVFYYFDEYEDLTPHPDRIANIEYDYTDNIGYQKNDAISKILAVANSIVDISQTMRYMAKENEARTFIDNGYIDPEQYIMLHTESMVCDKDIKTLADSIIVKANEYKKMNAVIESIRIKYGNKIKALKKDMLEEDEITEITETAIMELKEIIPE